jgi:SAM-dependent methyltransferase
VLDMPGGNGIATYAFAHAGFDVTCVEPDPSATLGRGAIEHVRRATGFHADIVDAYGECLPFADGTFDVVYVRQGLHHARDLPLMVAELTRVLKSGGLVIACREHVVDDYGKSLQDFLDSQIDHQLYGGENAFTLADYRSALERSGLSIEVELGPYDSVINAYPNTPEVLERRILESRPGCVLARVLPSAFVIAVGAWLVKRRKLPGRLYSFVALKA